MSTKLPAVVIRWCVGLWLLAPGLLCAQNTIGHLLTTHYTTQQGLANNRVTSIVQDRQGFIWCGTQAGLSRFDGYEFSNLKTDPKRPGKTFRNDAIFGLFEDHVGRLWATTLGDGLHQIDARRRESTAYRLDSANVFQYNNVFYTIAEASATDLWVGSQAGLLRYHVLSRQAEKLPRPAGLNEPAVLCQLTDQAQRLWIGTREGLFWLDLSTHLYHRQPLPVSAGTPQPIVSTLSLDSAGTLWVGTHGEAIFKIGSLARGLFRIETRRASLRTSVFPLVSPTGRSVGINAICLIGPTLWLGTDQGLFHLNPATGQTTLFRADRNRPEGLTSNTILALCPDQDGNLWVGTDNGLHKVNLASQRFMLMQLNPMVLTVRDPANNISAVVEDSTGTLWLGSPINGLYRVRPGTGQPVPVATQLVSPHVRALFRDRQGRLWLGTEEALYQINPQTGNLTRFPCRFPVQYIAQEAGGRLWIAGEGGPVSFDPATGQFAYLSDKLRQLMWYASSLCVSRSGYVWIGHTGGGVHRYNIRTGDLLQYLPDKPQQALYGYAVGLSDLNVTSLLEGADGRIWIGTQRGGINVLDQRTGKFRWLTTAQGLPSNYVQSLTTDRRGALWVATNQGLARYNAQTAQFRAYDQLNGLPMTQLTENSVGAGRTRLFFGGLDGCLAFNPDDLQPSNRQPPVFMTGLTVNGEERLLDTDHIDLDYQENGLTFSFAALSYRVPERNAYRYQLVGLDARWIESGPHHTARYAGVPPGEYTFQVQGANDDRVWNSRPASLTVVVWPPWWRSRWAYGVYLLLAMGGLWAFVRYRSRVLRRENQILEEKVALRTHEVEQQKVEIAAQRDHLEDTLTELKTTQNQLIQKEKLASLGELTAGIAHEIQNPLNFVNNFSEVSVELVSELRDEATAGHTEDVLAIADDLAQNLQKISLHGGRASRIVKGMLEHSRSTTGEKQPTDLNALANEYLRLGYQGVRAKDKGFICELVTDFDPAVGRVDVVPQDIGRVLLNLFNNAFYAVGQRATTSETDPAGYVPTVWVGTRRLAQTVEIQVRDNGTGISEAVKAKIFQPFFTTKPTGEGTGLGLSLSYDIVTKGHGGTLTVESREGAGTTFGLILPNRRPDGVAQG